LCRWCKCGVGCVLCQGQQHIDHDGSHEQPACGAEEWRSQAGSTNERARGTHRVEPMRAELGTCPRAVTACKPNARMPTAFTVASSGATDRRSGPTTSAACSVHR